MSRRKHLPRVNKLVLAIIVLVVGILVIFFLLNSPYFQIRKVTLSQNPSCVERGELIAKSGLLGRNILLINSMQIEKKLKDQYLCLLKVEFKKSYPGEVEVVLFSREPVLNITTLSGLQRLNLPSQSLLSDNIEATASSAAATYKLDFDAKESSISGKFLSDKQGYLFSRVQEDVVGLPIVYIVDSDISLGKQIPANLVDGLGNIIARFKELQYGYKDIKVIGENILINGDTKVVFSLDRDLNRQLASLQLIWQKAKMNSKSIDQIDLRFDKPVLIYGKR